MKTFSFLLYIIFALTSNGKSDISNSKTKWIYPYRNRTIKYIAFLFLLIGIISTNAEEPDIQWQKCLGGSNGETSPFIQKTSDGGYVVAGYTNSNDGDVSGNHGGLDIWVVKLNSSGNIQWQKCLGGSADDAAELYQSIRETSDNGFIVAGYTYSNNGNVSGNHGNSDYWVVKLNSSGNIQWQKCLGGSGIDAAKSINITSDGGYIVGGWTRSNDGDVSGNHGGVGDFWVVKLNSSGSIQWQKCLGGTGDDLAYSINNTSDGGFIVAGLTTSNDGDVSSNHGGTYDAWVVKLNSSGSIQWQKCLGGSGLDGTYFIQGTSDDGYIVAGNTTSNDGDVSGNHGGEDFWVVKLNSSGVIQWQKCLGGSANDDANSIQETSDGGYIVTGQSASNNGDVSDNQGGTYDAWVVRLNSSGVIQWQKCLGGSANDGSYSIQELINGDMIIAGRTTSNDGDVSGNHGDSDFWIVKLILNSITTNFSTSEVCAGDKVTVGYSTASPFNIGNSFTAQLSNSAGSFASPTVIGAVSSLSAGSIICTIPSNTPQGNSYRIRVISSNPAVTGDDNGSDIKINSLPTPSIVGPTVVCENDKYIYTCTAPGSTTSQWKVTNGKFEGQSSGNSVEVEWDSPPSGTITLVQTTTSNCVDSTYLVVTINPKADAHITTSDTILCVGQTGLYLSNNVAGTIYQWIVAGGTIIGASDTPTLNVRWDNTVTGVVRLIHTFSSTGCSDTTEINVIVSPKPQPQITSSDTVVCINLTGQYNSNTDNNAIYKWDATGGVIQGQDNNSSVSVLWNSEGTKKIKLIQTFPVTGCKDSAEMTITVNPLPSTQITGNTNVLLNTTEQYKANTPPGVVNTWTISFGTVIGSTSDSVISVKWESVGTGKVKLEQTILNTNCEEYDSLDITIYSTIPPLTLDAGANKELCKGESVQIGNPNAALGGVQPYRYKWTPSQGLSDDAIPNPVANPLQSTVYSLTVTDSRDSTDTDDVDVTVNPLPTPLVNGSTSALLNSEETYSANTPAGTTNIWSVTNGTQIGPNSGNTFIVQWDLIGQGTVNLEQVISATNCRDINSINVNVTTSIPALTVDAGSDKEICMNESIQIGSSNPPTGGSPPYRYLWTPSQGLSNDTVPNPIANPEQSTVYILTVTDSKDSTASDSVIVTVNPFPEAPVRGNRNVQLNSIVTYSVESPAGIINEWFVENGTQIGPNNDSTFRVQWNNLGNGRVISLQTITATGCSEADSIDITITTSIPELTAYSGSDKFLCLGDAIQIGTVNAASGGVEPYKYKWTPSVGLNNDTIPNPMAKSLQTTVYNLIVTDALDSVSTDEMTLTVNSLPIPNITGNDKAMRGTIITYSVNIQAGTTNEWTVENGTQIGSGKGNTFQVRWDSAGTGIIIVEQLIISTGCHASDTLVVTVDAQQYAAILDLPDMSAEPGGEIYLPIFLRDAELLRNTNVTGIIADLKFNASLLEPIETTPIGTLSADGKERIIPLRLGVTPSLDSTLEYLSFMATLGNDSTTEFRLENISSIGANVNIGSLTGTFTLKGICREGGTRLIGSNGQVMLMLVRPNPAQEYAEIEYETTESGRTKLYLVNALGETALSLVNGEVPKGRKVIRMNIVDIRSGTYFLILKTTTQVRSVRVDVVK